MFLIGCAIIFTILSVTILFVAASVWLGQHGGARRWQIWLLYVLSACILTSTKWPATRIIAGTKLSSRSVKWIMASI